MSSRGWHHTAESRAKLAAALKGKTLTVEHRRKLSESLRGRPKSQEARRKLSEAMRGNQRTKGLKFSERTRARMRGNQNAKGHVVSAEVRAKIATAHLGNNYAQNAPIKGECVYCFEPAQTHDHIIPRGRPGWDAPENEVPACVSCNASKGNRTPAEWFSASNPPACAGIKPGGKS